MARLGDVVTVSASTQMLDSGQIWLLNLDMVEQQTGDIISYNYVTRDKLNGSIIQFDTGNVLYSKLRPNLNKVVIPSQSGFATSEMLPLRPDTSVLTREYLTAYLRSDSFVEWAVSKTAGAKMPRLGTKELLNKDMPVPTLEEQKHITQILNRVNCLISLRKQQLAKLDELVKARFAEMFGDPRQNPKRLPICQLSDLGRWSSGGTPSRTCSEYFTGSIDWYSAGELNCLYLLESIEKITPDAVANSAAKIFPKGSMLVGMYDSAAFKMGILTKDSASNQACACIEPNGKIDIVWLYYELLLMKDFFLSQRRGVRQKNLNLGMIQSFCVPLAALEEQLQFSAFVSQMSNSTLTIHQSLNKLEMLKKLLMQKYFM